MPPPSNQPWNPLAYAGPPAQSGVRTRLPASTRCPRTHAGISDHRDTPPRVVLGKHRERYRQREHREHEHGCEERRQDERLGPHAAQLLGAGYEEDLLHGACWVLRNP